MSTNKTENLQLHSWVETDGFSRREFNENFSAIDENAGKTWDELAGKADAATVSAMQATLGTKASVAAGYYNGNGSATRFISCGFTPKIAIVWKNGLVMEDVSGRYGGVAVVNYSTGAVSIVDGGFQVVQTGSCPANASGTSYTYLALG